MLGRPVSGLDLEVPGHFCIEQGQTMQIVANEEFEYEGFLDAVAPRFVSARPRLGDTRPDKLHNQNLVSDHQAQWKSERCYANSCRTSLLEEDVNYRGSNDQTEAPVGWTGYGYADNSHFGARAPFKDASPAKIMPVTRYVVSQGYQRAPLAAALLATHAMARTSHVTSRHLAEDANARRFPHRPLY